MASSSLKLILVGSPPDPPSNKEPGGSRISQWAQPVPTKLVACWLGGYRSCSIEDFGPAVCFPTRFLLNPASVEARTSIRVSFTETPNRAPSVPRWRCLSKSDVAQAQTRALMATSTGDEGGHSCG